MDETQLRNFVMIGRCASITEAADRLGIAQPSLSQQLLRLEDEFGTQLFRRTSRGVVATDAGRMLQEHAATILQAMNRAREEVQVAERVPQGQVAIGLPATASMLLGVPLLVAARTSLPLVTVHIREATTATIRRWLDEGRIELGVLYDAEGLRHLSTKVVARETLLLVGPAGAFGETDAFGIAIEPVAQPALKTYDFILPSVSHGLRALIERQLHMENFSLSAVIEIDSLAHTKTLVASRIGYSVLPHAAVCNELASGELSAANVEGIDLSRSVSFVRNPSQPLTRASIAVEDLARRLLREMIAEGQWLATPVEDE
jgi:LysR family transcriptional regulator, nitrogen assimilation regulatory protein